MVVILKCYLNLIYCIVALQLNPQQQNPIMQTSLFEDADGNLDGAEDIRLTVFIASSSIIILSLITIIGVVSCFILCNDEPVSTISIFVFDIKFISCSNLRMCNFSCHDADTNAYKFVKSFFSCILVRIVTIQMHRNCKI